MAKREFRDCNEDRLSQRFIIETSGDIQIECHLYQLLKLVWLLCFCGSFCQLSFLQLLGSLEFRNRQKEN